MHPYFIMLSILCGAWFFSCVAMARRSFGAQVGFGFLGAVGFFIVAGVIGQFMKGQDFFLRALGKWSDIRAIMTYEALPAVAVIFVSGLLLKRILSRRASSQVPPPRVAPIDSVAADGEPRSTRVIACPHCGTRVVPTSAGECPSCRKTVVPP
jgi:hypothetical protein